MQVNFKLNAIKTVNLANISELEIPKKKDYEFCIIIPNYNNDHGNIEGKTFLQKCIESVLNQTYKNFAIIIVDDMSTDTSVKTIEKYRKQDNRITLIKNNRKRYNGGSRNVGIEYAMNNLDFDYFAMLDSDDFFVDDNVLQKINDNLWDCDLMLIGLKMIFLDNSEQIKLNEYNNYEEFFLSDNKTWCTAWSRVVKKEKMVYFPEDTLMEDRVWSYKLADNVDFNKVRNLKEVCYIWNRKNTTNSVSLKRGKIWEASMWKHIGQQLMLLEELKHEEFGPLLKKRIKHCIELINQEVYQQY